VTGTEVKVSVIVPVYDCRDTLGRALRSVFEQSLDGALVEPIAVDDGSTDGGAELLAEIARDEPRLRVLRRANSGGPGAPRNLGMEHARGEYVFFLDADDHLGPEALERMCAAADAHGTDIVVGRYVGVGRGVSAFDVSRDRVTLGDPDLDLFAMSLTAHKLFRRSLLERHGIRFPEGVLSGEDKVFTAHAYLHAGAASVVADHDCYYLVARESGTSIVQRGGAPAADYYGRIALPLVERAVSHTGPGFVRDRLLVRLFSLDVLHRFDELYLAAPPEVRKATRDGARMVCADHLTPAVLERLPVHKRVIAHCLREGQDEHIAEVVRAHLAGRPELAVDGDRAFSAYPGFRSAGVAVPDELFEVTEQVRASCTVREWEWSGGRLVLGGTARLERVGLAGQSVEVVLRRKDGEEEIPLRARAAEPGEFAAEFVPGRRLSPGLWEAHVRVSADRLTRERRASVQRDPEPPLPECRLVPGAGVVLTPALTPNARHVSLKATALDAKLLRELLCIRSVTWTDGTRLRIRAVLPIAGEDVTLPPISLWWARRGKPDILKATVEPAGNGTTFDAVTDLRGCASGTWDAWCRFDDGNGSASAEARLALADEPDAVMARSVPVSGAFSLRRRRAQIYRTVKGSLSVRVRSSVRR
jgi:hypothetical protein